MTTPVHVILISIKIIILLATLVISIFSIVKFIRNFKNSNTNGTKFILIVVIYSCCILITCVLVVLELISIKFNNNALSIFKFMFDLLNLGLCIALVVILIKFVVSENIETIKDLKILAFTQLGLMIVSISFSIISGIYVFNYRRKILKINPAVLKLLSDSSDWLQTSNWTRLFPTNPQSESDTDTISTPDDLMSERLESERLESERSHIHDLPHHLKYHPNLYQYQENPLITDRSVY